MKPKPEREYDLLKISLLTNKRWGYLVSGFPEEAPENLLCASLPNSAFSHVTLVAWDWPPWEYLHMETGKWTLQIRDSPPTLRGGIKHFTTISLSRTQVVQTGVPSCRPKSISWPNLVLVMLLPFWPSLMGAFTGAHKCTSRYFKAHP